MVIPEVGAHYAPPGTSVTFEGVKPADLAGLRVSGSHSGLHAGRLSPLIGAEGEVFKPARPFSAGEIVTVTTPHLEAPGAHGDRYTFRIYRPASPSQAARAFEVASSEDGISASSATTSTAPRVASRSKSCPLISYHSAPGLDAQRACQNLGVTAHGTVPGNYLFLSPSGYNGAGAGIFQPNGDLVWWDKHPAGVDYDFSEVFFQNQPYLALWVAQHATDTGRGEVILYNDHYQRVGTITAGGGFPPDYIDLHEFQVTRQGDALVGLYAAVRDTYAGRTVTVLDYVVQKLSLVRNSTGIHTGSLLFQWDSLDHVGVGNSYSPEPAAGGTWDYFHGNAITQDSDGNIIVSSRNTWGLYKINVTTGKMMWAVGGKNEPTLAEPWCYQHDIAALGNDTYSLFDDGGAGPGCAPGSTQHASRGLIIKVVPGSGINSAHLSLVQAYTHNPPTETEATGSTERLRNGDVIVDWGLYPEITEFTASGTADMDLSLSAWSYRGFSLPWVGLPLTKPSVAAEVTSGGDTNVWMSWNGSTLTTGWEVLAGLSSSHLAKVGKDVAKNGFETPDVLPARYAVVEVKALNSAGKVLSTSDAMKA